MAKETIGYVVFGYSFGVKEYLRDRSGGLTKDRKLALRFKTRDEATAGLVCHDCTKPHKWGVTDKIARLVRR